MALTREDKLNMVALLGGILEGADATAANAETIDAFFAALLLHYGPSAAQRLAQLCDISPERFR